MVQVKFSLNIYLFSGYRAEQEGGYMEENRSPGK